MSNVLVIGGGLAGLTSALTLQELGHSVHVLEARPRVGGRTHTLRDLIQGRCIDAGGEFIGSIHKHWLQYARRFGLGLSVLTTDNRYEEMGLRSRTFLRGRHLDDCEEEMLWERVEAAQLALRDLAQATVPVPSCPWDTPEATRYDTLTVQQWLVQTPSLQAAHVAASADDLGRTWLQDWFDQHLQNEFGVPTRHISMLALMTQLAEHGDDFWSHYEVYRCADGAQALAEAMAATLGDVVTLSSPARTIDISSNRVTVSSGSQTFEADFAVLAAPPSVWNQITVTPALPMDYRVQMGIVIKHITHVSRRFWLHQGLAPDAFHESIGSLWEPTDQQSGPDRMALAAFAGGPLAEQAIAAADREAFYAPHLEAMFPSFTQHRLGSRFCNWPEEEWTRGGYSCPAPGQITGAMRKLNNEPWHDRLFFAGEHTSPQYFGFMEGAIRSGERVGRQIHQCSES